MGEGPLVGVAVPAWRSGDFLGEALASLLAQSYRNLRIVISIDGDDTDTGARCEAFLPDPRIRVLRQPARLGWVRNSALALAAAAEGAAYACIVAHDDILHEQHFAALVAMAGRHGDAAIVFPDFEAFGTERGIVSQDSIIGHKLARQLSILLDHYNAIAWHGLARTSALAAVEPMTPNEVGDFAVDTVWVARMARQGNLVRLPEVLLRKRYHPGNTHGAWAGMPDRDMARAWTVHCLAMLAEAWPTADSADERRLLVGAARRRLLGPPSHVGPFSARIRGLGLKHRMQMELRFRVGVMRLGG